MSFECNPSNPKKMLRKCLFIIVFVSFCELTQAQYTAIPDENFELALIDLGLDIGDVDGQVVTANLAEVDDLNVNDAGISDLTGLAGFVALERLHCAGNELNAVDLTVLPLLYYLHCNDNNLTTLDFSMNPLMRTILCSDNQLATIATNNLSVLRQFACDNNVITALDVSNNLELDGLFCRQNDLTELDLSANTVLESLRCNDNELTELDLSGCIELETFNCSNNLLTCLNLNTGMQTQLEYDDEKFQAMGNPELTCIEVFDPEWGAANLISFFDGEVTFSNQCDNACSSQVSGIQSVQFERRSLVKVMDYLGREVPVTFNTPLIYLFNDGTVERVFLRN